MRGPWALATVVVFDVVLGLGSARADDVAPVAIEALPPWLAHELTAPSAPLSLPRWSASRPSRVLWIELPHGERGLFLARFDAHDEALLTSLDRLDRDVDARVYRENPVVDLAPIEVMWPAGITTLVDGRIDVRSCDPTEARTCALTRYAAPDAMGNFLFEPVLTPALDDAFAEVMAFHHLRAELDHLATLGFTPACTVPYSIVVNHRAARDEPYDNALFVPGATPSRCALIQYGQGTYADYAYDADVLVHELGHAVTSQLSDVGSYRVDGLGVSFDPLAVNEALSDAWAALAHDDPEIGEYVATRPDGGVGALRDLAASLTCPASLTGRPHADGRLLSSVFFAVGRATSRATAELLLLETTRMLTERPTLADAAATVLIAARALEARGEVDTSVLGVVESEVRSRGLVDCARFVPLTDTPTTGYSGRSPETTVFGAALAPIQFVLDVPARATALAVALEPLESRGEYVLHARRGRPVAVERGMIVSDERVAIGRRGQLRFDGLARTVPRCETLYVAVETRDLDTSGDSLYTLRAILTEGPEQPCTTARDAGVDGGVDAAAPRDAASPADADTWVARGGCHVTSTRSAPSRGALRLWLVALAFGFARSRRHAMHGRRAARGGREGHTSSRRR